MKNTKIDNDNEIVPFSQKKTKISIPKTRYGLWEKRAEKYKNLGSVHKFSQFFHLDSLLKSMENSSMRREQEPFQDSQKKMAQKKSWKFFLIIHELCIPLEK